MGLLDLFNGKAYNTAMQKMADKQAYMEAQVAQQKIMAQLAGDQQRMELVKQTYGNQGGPTGAYQQAGDTMGMLPNGEATEGAMTPVSPITSGGTGMWSQDPVEQSRTMAQLLAMKDVGSNYAPSFTSMISQPGEYKLAMEKEALSNKGRMDVQGLQNAGSMAVARLNEAGANSRSASSSSPYYNFIQTPQGIITGNARTGQLEQPFLNGKPVVGSTSDPQLQGDIAGAKAGGKEIGETTAKAGINLPKVIAQGEETIKLVDDLLSHPGMDQAVGTSSAFQVQKIPGTKAKDFMLRLEQLQGKQFLQAFESLKGGGQITELEGQKAQSAMSRMQNGGSEEEFTQASREFQDIVRAGIERAKQQANSNNPRPGHGGTIQPQKTGESQTSLMPAGAVRKQVNPTTGAVRYLDAAGKPL